METIIGEIAIVRASSIGEDFSSGASIPIVVP
jgi:hypothetical protein